MPCTDGGVPYPPSPAEIRAAETAKKIPAMLCATIRAAMLATGKPFQHLLTYVDEVESGIKRKDLEDWWRKHVREDEERRKAAKKRAKAKAIRMSALKKLRRHLTRAEQKSLGH